MAQVHKEHLFMPNFFFRFCQSSLGISYIIFTLFLFCRSGAFSHLKFVTTLALSHCDIETVEDGAFEGMEALSEVKLESNKLLYLQGTGLFPKHLNHIEVRKSFFSSTFTIGDSDFELTLKFDTTKHDFGHLAKLCRNEF